MADSAHNVHLGIIGGTGLGDRLAQEFPSLAKTVHVTTPFGDPASPILTGPINGTPVAVLSRHGAGHLFNPSRVPYRANVFALKSLGVTHLIASGATGSLREDIHPGEVVLVDQFIDKTTDRARTFFENAAVHVEFAQPTCPDMRDWLAGAAKRINQPCHERGTYVCMEGPAFSTRAESELHRQWGGDLIGMTALPEARLAREAEMAYALIALPTDFDCWKPHDPTAPAQSLLAEIIANLNKASDAALCIIRQALTDVQPISGNPSAAHHALALAIWSDKSQIAPADRDRLAPLWGRYFE